MLAARLTHGHGNAGTMIGCLRKLQGWNLTSTLEEYKRFVGPKIRVLNEQFIELFDVDLVRVPHSPPKWFHRERDPPRDNE